MIIIMLNFWNSIKIIIIKEEKFSGQVERVFRVKSAEGGQTNICSNAPLYLRHFEQRFYFDIDS